MIVSLDLLNEVRRLTRTAGREFDDSAMANALRGARRRLREVKDASGHEHAADGKFGSGGSKSDNPSAGDDKDAASDSGKVHKNNPALLRMTAAVKEMEGTPAGRDVLAKGAAIVGRVHAAVSRGVQKALAGLDDGTLGGVSLIAGGLRRADPKAFSAGVARCINSVIECVHEEIFETAMSSASIPGAHLVGKAAATAAGHAESLLLKAVSWAFGKVRGKPVREALEGDFNDSDRALLAVLVKIAAEGIEAAGGKAPDDLAEKIGAKLRGETKESLRAPLSLLMEAGFSGEKKDRLGRRNCYADGKRVKCAGPTQPAPVAKHTVDSMHAHIEAARKEGLTPEKVAAIGRHLQHLKVAELNELKKRLGVSASGAKAELAKKIAEKALAGKPKPIEKPKPILMPAAAQVTPPVAPPSNLSPATKVDYPKEARPPLDATEADAVRRYTAGAHRGLNVGLWETGKVPETHADVDRGLQAAFAKVKEFPKPVKVRRGANLYKSKVAELAAKKPGEEITFPAYSSTTTKKGTFRGNVEFNISATRGLDVKGTGDADTQKERELLLDRGSRFRIVGVKKSGNKLVVNLEQVR